MALTRPKFAQFDTTITSITDPQLVLNKNSTIANVDIGFVFNRDGGTASNVGVIWQESDSRFALIQTSNSGVTNSNISVSSYANLRVGRLIADDGLFYSNGNPISTGGGGGSSSVTVGEIDGGSVRSNSVTGVSTISFNNSTGFHVSDLGSGEVMVSLGSAFKTIQVAGQSNVVASGEDTLTLVAGNNISITTNATSKAITIGTTPDVYGLGANGTWTAANIGLQNMYWGAVAYGGGKYIATNGGFNYFSYSTDGGFNWNVIEAPWSTYPWVQIPATFRPLAYGNGTWVLSYNQNSDHRDVATSPDGITWTKHANATPLTTNIDEAGHEWFGVIFDGSQFVMYSSGVRGSPNSGYPRIISSTDGITWTGKSPTLYPNNITTSDSLGHDAIGPYYQMDLAHGGGTYVSIGIGYNTVGGGIASNSAFYSTNLTSWTKVTLPFAGSWQRVAYGNGVFIALSVGPSRAIRSYDLGHTWTEITIPGTTYNNITYGNGQWLLLQADNSDSANWTPTSYSDDDGTTWHSVNMPVFSGYYGPFTGGYTDVTFGEAFVAVSQDPWSLGVNLVAVSDTLGSCCYGNANVSAYLSSGNITVGGIKTDNYYYANGTPISFSGGGSSYGNTQVAEYLAVNPQPGTYSNSNVSSYLTANPEPGTYSNSNVASYLTTYTGNITAGNVLTDNYLYANGAPISFGGGTSEADHIINGTSNVQVYSNSSVTVSVAGTANVVTVTNDTVQMPNLYLANSAGGAGATIWFNPTAGSIDFVIGGATIEGDLMLLSGTEDLMSGSGTFDLMV